MSTVSDYHTLWNHSVTIILFFTMSYGNDIIIIILTTLC